MKISSNAFEDGGEIPSLYTCEGKNISPKLIWKGIPSAAKSLVLIVEDPDAPDPKAPKMVWLHWVLYNIDPNTTGLPENVAIRDLPRGTQRGLTSWKNENYGGPCPPIGRHRYFHRLYALDIVINNLEKPTADQLREAMEGHIIEEAVLMGTYEKKEG
ncbi:MAG: YbhB/YbcL family Raf kinase inhibitor-like protein [Gammaproteobacteria bacterium]|jgi:Raf kinase inhibitor-like YbhB/YbcL family protein|nr:YbhB/YbcL family Raf kinase inhibitor-like protein [Gammaproteobacteria bacterium]